MSRCKCGSYAINHRNHGRDGTDGDLCDVCFWRKRAEKNGTEIDALNRYIVQLEAAVKNLTPNALDQAPQPEDDLR